MKKILIATATVLVLSSCMPVLAAPEIMADGTVFDAEYYAQANPDVTQLYGTDKDALFNHYIMFGKAEGRAAYEQSTPQSPSTESSQIDLDGVKSSLDITDIEDITGIATDTHDTEPEVLSGWDPQADTEAIIESVKRDILIEELGGDNYHYHHYYY